ncbi:MAG: sigma-70 family RNA polymerase sigma factor [Clostridiales bacterium]|nr:sigma-70 family RNA polymerase sigma factor [Clostridiales bacterium]
MNTWKKYRNYRKINNPDGSFTYVIFVDGVTVEVSAEVYKAYSRSARQLEYMERDLKRDRVLQDAHGRAVVDAYGRTVVLPELEVSLDRLMDEDWDFPAEDQPEDMVLLHVETISLHHCLNLIDATEKTLIQALFFERKTEREYSAETGISQQTIHARKRVILAKLKKLLKNQK